MKRALRGGVAVIVGFVVVGALSIITSRAVGALGLHPVRASGAPLAVMSILEFGARLVGRAFAGALGGFVTARIASVINLRIVYVLAVIVLVRGIVDLYGWSLPLGLAVQDYTLVAVTAIGVVGGGTLARRRIA